MHRKILKFPRLEKNNFLKRNTIILIKCNIVIKYKHNINRISAINEFANGILHLIRCLYDKEFMIDQWIEENKDPDLKKDKTMQMITDEIKLMMFNNKNLIE